jgi:hypothetical protein
MYSQSEKQKAEGKAQRANMEANAAQTEFSPWSGMKAEGMNQKAIGGTAEQLGAGLGAGMQGYQFGKQFGGSPAPAAMPTTPSGFGTQAGPPGMDAMKKPSLYDPNMPNTYKPTV